MTIELCLNKVQAMLCNAFSLSLDTSRFKSVWVTSLNNKVYKPVFIVYLSDYLSWQPCSFRWCQSLTYPIIALLTPPIYPMDDNHWRQVWNQIRHLEFMCDVIFLSGALSYILVLRSFRAIYIVLRAFGIYGIVRIPRWAPYYNHLMQYWGKHI